MSQSVFFNHIQNILIPPLQNTSAKNPNVIYFKKHTFLQPLWLGKPKFWLAGTNWKATESGEWSCIYAGSPALQ
jgi:hypothetical protein